MSKKRCHHSAAVVRLRVYRWEEDLQAVLPGEDSPEQNNMLTRRVSNEFICRKLLSSPPSARDQGKRHRGYSLAFDYVPRALSSGAHKPEALVNAYMPWGPVSSYPW